MRLLNFGHRDGISTRAGILTALRLTLVENGWRIDRQVDPRFQFSAHISAVYENTRVLIFAGGVDHPITITQVDDLVRATVGLGVICVFASGSRVDPYTLARIQGHRALTVDTGDATNLVSLLNQLPPRLAGAIDLLRLSGVLYGWAKFSHGDERASIEGMLDDRRIGNAIADEYREDLVKLGDGRFAFSMSIPPVEDGDYFLGKVRVRVFRNGVFIGLIHVRPGIPII